MLLLAVLAILTITQSMCFGLTSSDYCVRANSNRMYFVCSLTSHLLLNTKSLALIFWISPTKAPDQRQIRACASQRRPQTSSLNSSYTDLSQIEYLAGSIAGPVKESRLLSCLCVSIVIITYDLYMTLLDQALFLQYLISFTQENVHAN